MSDERSLEPTIKRRQQARQEGRVATTPYLGSAVTWLVFFAALYASSGWCADYAQDSFGELSNDTMELFESDGIPTAERLMAFVRERCSAVGIILLPGLMAIAGLAALSRLAQFGFLWVPNRLAPDLSRINPAQRTANLLSTDSLVQLLRGTLLIATACMLVGYGIWSQRNEVANSLTANVGTSLQMISVWGLRLGGALLIFALLDFGYQRWRFENSLRMSPDEMRAEVKAVEGSGQLTAERRKRWQQYATSVAETSD